MNGHYRQREQMRVVHLPTVAYANEIDFRKDGGARRSLPDGRRRLVYCQCRSIGIGFVEKWIVIDQITGTNDARSKLSYTCYCIHPSNLRKSRACNNEQ